MNKNEIHKEIKKIKLKNFFLVYLVLTLISLLSVIPFNLNMRIYEGLYVLVPFSSSILLLFLPLLISFPFYDLSRQLMVESDHKYRFIQSKTTIKIIFMVLFAVAFIVALIFYSPTNIDEGFALSLCVVAILVGYLPTIPLMMIFETLTLAENHSREKNCEFKRKSIYITLGILISASISQFLVLFNFAIFGILAAIFLGIFFSYHYQFFKSEKEKQIPKEKTIIQPLYILILQIVYIVVTSAYCVILLLYMFVLTRGYLIINFEEFYSGFFLAIHGSYTLLFIFFYSIIYTIMRRKGIFEYVNESSGVA